MESKLIEAVQMYPCLFDKNKRDYRNKKQKEEAWASVAEETGETVERCQHRWRSLRDRYVRELMIKSKTGSTSGTRWVFMDALSFLQNHVAPYSRTTSKRESTSSEPQVIEVNPLEESDSCPLNSYLSCCFDDTNKCSPLLESPIPSQSKRRKLPDNVVPQCKAHEQFEALCSAVNDLLETKKVTEKSRNADFFKVLDSYLQKHTEEDQDRLKIQILELVFHNPKSTTISYVNSNED